MSRHRKREPPAPESDDDVLEGADSSLLEIVDHVLNKGVLITGDLMLGVADVDLVYIRISAMLCASDRIFPGKKS